MTSQLTCAVCAKSLACSPSSLPQGQATCQPCRRARRSHRRTCAHCGGTFGGQGIRYCSKICANQATSAHRAPRPGYRKRSRDCEICGATYHATHRDQHTCGRACGERLRREISGTLQPIRTWQSCTVTWKTCRICGTDFTNTRRRSTCSAACGDILTSSTYQSARIMQRYHSDPEFRDHVIAKSEARRADKLGLGDLHITIAYLQRRDRNRCGICREPVKATTGPMRPSMDHIIPLSRGGEHELVNVQLAHLRCNLVKHNGGGGEQLLLIG